MRSTPDSPIRNSRAAVWMPLLISGSLVLGLLIGSAFWKGSPTADASNGAAKLREILLLIENNYVDSVNTDQLVDFSIKRMLEKLDPHTSYYNTDEAGAARSQLESGFDGIGVEFTIYNDTVFVVSPLSGGPSEAVGIMSGDRILRVNGERLSGPGVTNASVYKLLRGKRGTEVKMDIAREGNPSPIPFTVVRNRIPTYSVEAAYMVDSQIGYIKVTRFSEGTFDEFKQALSSLKEKGMSKMILDLRGNPGGYMEKATQMADELLADEKMLVYTKGKDRRYNREIFSKTKGMFEKGPLIVLVDEGSASASEIVAGALQDHDRALVVGRRSFGKGLVQMPIKLQDGGELRLTISRYYTPSGRSIQKPYEMGKNENYERDASSRFRSGELFHADSIRLDSSLSYKTAGGRPVFGGGGILPDVFVPRDTSMNTTFLFELYSKNILREYAARYANTHMSSLERQTFEQFAATFVVTDAMLSELVADAKKVGIRYNEKQMARSKPMIQAQTKALIARYVWGKNRQNGLSNEIYQIVNPTDPVFREALRQFGKAEALEKGQWSSLKN